MSKKAKKSDVAELDATANVPDETGAGKTVEAGVAGAGQANEAQAADATGSDEVATTAAPDTEVPGTADAAANAADAEKPETEKSDLSTIDVDGRSIEVLTVRFAEDAHCCLKLDDVEWLAKADRAAAVNYRIEADRVIWPDLDNAWLTFDELGELAFTGNSFPGKPDTPKNRIGINVLSAYAAASIAYGTTEEDSTAFPRIDLGWLTSGENHQEAAECAAAFLRRNAAMLVQPETLVIHLRRSGFSNLPDAVDRVASAWRIFMWTLAELDRLDKANAEEEQRAELAAQAQAGPRAALREDLTMAPADPNPLTDLGQRLQRS